MTIDRALIVRKKYLDLIFDNGKTWEMRSRPTNIHGMIGLIEAGSGMIVGEAYLDGSEWPLNEYTAAKNQDRHQVENHALLLKWRYPWVLRDAKRYDTPIPYKHPRGAVIWVKVGDLK